uniref:ATP synthase subunit a n=1 Tax=Modiolus modiolus TaxID=40256 RepID=A0A1L7H853_MODMO|nr:ATP synthase F0 subunit 6 [Modiolus modiolus]
MALDILSSFDSYCGSSVSCYFLWGSGGVVFLVWFSGGSVKLSVVKAVFNKALAEIYASIKSVEGNKVSGVCLSISSLFLFIVLLNLASLVPFGFGLSMDLSGSLGLSVLLWVSLLVSGVRVSMGKSLAILVPNFSPLWMVGFLSAVEVVSVLCRPLTLGARLMINLIAGHMILVMLSSGAVHTSIRESALSVGFDFCLIGLFVAASLYFKKETLNRIVLAVVIFCWVFKGVQVSKKKIVAGMVSKYGVNLGIWFFMSVLLVMEMGISVLQGFIFCSLLCLYSNEHPS